MTNLTITILSFIKEVAEQMRKWKVILIEDDNVILNRMQRMLEEDDQLEIIGLATSYKELQEIFTTSQPDFIISDIDLPDNDGIQIAKEILQNDLSIPFIFISGHAQYAVESYQVEAVDYLLKPIEKHQLQRALGKMKKKLSSDHTNVKRKAHPLNVSKLYVRKEDGFVFIDISSIVLIRKEGKKTAIITLHMEGSKAFHCTYLTNQTMKELFEVLKERSFLRSHNSYIINPAWIKEVVHFTQESYKIIFNKTDEYALLNKEKLPLLIELLN